MQLSAKNFPCTQEFKGLPVVVYDEISDIFESELLIPFRPSMFLSGLIIA